jgi:leader peptidase (prepilin peptidase)/N-methyltransferase
MLVIPVLCGLCGLVAGYAGRWAIVRTAGDEVPGWVFRWFLPELATGLLFALAGWRLGLTVELFLACYVIVLGVALSIVDIATHRLPNVLTLPSYAVIGLGLVLVSVFLGDWALLGRAAIAMVVAGAVFGILFAVGGMGLGDVKLAGVLGLALGWFGWPQLVTGLVLGFVYGGLVSGVLLVAGRAGRKTRIPFGPFMIAAAVTAFLVADWLGRVFLPMG